MHFCLILRAGSDYKRPSHDIWESNKDAVHDDSPTRPSQELPQIYWRKCCVLWLCIFSTSQFATFSNFNRRQRLTSVYQRFCQTIFLRSNDFYLVALKQNFYLQHRRCAEMFESGAAHIRAHTSADMIFFMCLRGEKRYHLGIRLLSYEIQLLYIQLIRERLGLGFFFLFIGRLIVSVVVSTWSDLLFFSIFDFWRGFDSLNTHEVISVGVRTV